MFFFQVFTNGRMFMFGEALKEMPGCTMYIQHNLYRTDHMKICKQRKECWLFRGKFGLYHFDVINDFSTSKHCAQITSNFLSSLR